MILILVDLAKPMITDGTASVVQYFSQHLLGCCFVRNTREDQLVFTVQPNNVCCFGLDDSQLLAMFHHALSNCDLWSE